MLFIVLILVLAALGLLVTALITANSLWAWVSIALSLLAALFLVVDYFRRRSRRKRAEAAAAEPADADATVVDAEPVDATAAGEAEETAEPAEEAEEEAAAAAETGDPAEEKSAPADVEVVSELDVEVVVVDEYPRYHLVECTWLEGRDTIPIAVKEARDLGFTPCARCAPDAKLAEDHRAKA